MDFSITITLFVQIINSIMGIYILTRIYIAPVVQELIAEDLIAQKLEILISEEKHKIAQEKESFRLHNQAEHKALKEHLLVDTLVEKEGSISLENMVIDTPPLDQTITLFTAAIIDEVKAP